MSIDGAGLSIATHLLRLFACISPCLPPIHRIGRIRWSVRPASNSVDLICDAKFQGWCRDTLGVDLTTSETATVLSYMDRDMDGCVTLREFAQWLSGEKGFNPIQVSGVEWSGVKCHAMLCYAMLCYALLCHAMLCYATHYCTALTTPHRAVSLPNQSIAY